MVPPGRAIAVFRACGPGSLALRGVRLIGLWQPLAGDQLTVILDELPTPGVLEHVALDAVREMGRADLVKFVRFHAQPPQGGPSRESTA